MKPRQNMKHPTYKCRREQIDKKTWELLGGFDEPLLYRDWDMGKRKWRYFALVDIQRIQ